MGLIIGIIALIIGLSLFGGLLGVLKESELGKVFLFAMFIIIVCIIFGGFVPFAELIIKIAGFIVVALIVWFGAKMIFG